MKKIIGGFVSVIIVPMFLVFLCQIFVYDMALEAVWPFQNKELGEYVQTLLVSKGIPVIYLYIAGRIAGVGLLAMLTASVLSFRKGKECGKA
ncbi:MAG: hypothetical protein WC022_00075 [Parcubacteria group bacterium]